MKLTVKDINGKEKGQLEVKFSLVEGGRGTQAVHDTIVAYQAAQRRGTACTKTMGEVAGSGKKPWRQKGTGPRAPDHSLLRCGAAVAWCSVPNRVISARPFRVGRSNSRCAKL